MWGQFYSTRGENIWLKTRHLEFLPAKTGHITEGGAKGHAWTWARTDNRTKDKHVSQKAHFQLVFYGKSRPFIHKHIHEQANQKEFLLPDFWDRTEWGQIIRRTSIGRGWWGRNSFLFKESENTGVKKDSMQWTYHHDKNKLEKKNIWLQQVAPLTMKRNEKSMFSMMNTRQSVWATQGQRQRLID